MSERERGTPGVLDGEFFRASSSRSAHGDDLLAELGVAASDDRPMP
ncbi:hypothetical protein [Nonomuraea rubra]